MLSQRIRRKYERYPDDLMIETAIRLRKYHLSSFPKMLLREKEIENAEDAILFINWYLRYADGLLIEPIRARTVEELIMKLDIIGS